VTNKMTAVAERASDDDDDFETVIAARLISGLLEAKAISDSARATRVLREACDIADLYFDNVRNCLKIVRGEKLDD
jgi:hypothetical protein